MENENEFEVKEEKRKSRKIDPEIMDELLALPKRAARIKKKTPAEVEHYKELLVSSGVYDEFRKQRKHRKMEQ